MRGILWIAHGEKHLQEAVERGKAVAVTKTDRPSHGAELPMQKDVSMAEAMLTLDEEEGRGGKSRG